MFIFWKVLISFIVPNTYRKFKLYMLPVAYSLLHSASFTWLVCFAKYFNPFQPGAAFHIETTANQMTGFYVKCNTPLKYVKGCCFTKTTSFVEPPFRFENDKRIFIKHKIPARPNETPIKFKIPWRFLRLLLIANITSRRWS